MTNEEAWIDLCEKSDRSSPEGQPDMALINQEELFDYLESVRAEAALAEREACAKVLDKQTEEYLKLASESRWEAKTVYSLLAEKLNQSYAAIRARTSTQAEGKPKAKFSAAVERALQRCADLDTEHQAATQQPPASPSQESNPMQRQGGGFDLGEGRVGQGDRARLDVIVGEVMHDGDVDVELPNGGGATVKWRFVHPSPSQEGGMREAVAQLTRTLDSGDPDDPCDVFNKRDIRAILAALAHDGGSDAR